MITTPKLYLISRPHLVLSGLEAFLRDRNLKFLCSEGAGQSEHIIEICGRLCYMSFSDDPSEIRHPNARYILNLIEQRHESVLEHVSWTFILDDVSRAFTHQLVRHRVGFAYSQLSQQYHEETDAEFVEPAGLSAEALVEWRSSLEMAKEVYRKLLALSSDVGEADMSLKEQVRLARSAARGVLPNATKTAIAVTANARALRHFIDVRGAINGDVEMRLVSAEIYKMLSAEAPTVVSDFELFKQDDGWPLVRSK